MSILFPNNPGTSLGEAVVLNETDDRPSPEWLEEMFPNNSFIDSQTHVQIRGFCRDVLTYSDPWIGFRYWDVAILVPNFMFLLFLLFNIRCVFRKMTSSNSPVIRAFFVLIYLTTLMNVLRCVVSMTITVTNPFGDLIDKSLWIAIKFFYMTAELSVLMFALLFGHLDSATSIRRALIACVFGSLLHTSVQTVIELQIIDKSIMENTLFDVHDEGGLVFWILSSAFFILIYIFVLCLPLTCVRKYVTLPSRCSFYWYCLLLSLLNLLQVVGSLLLFFKSQDGLCFIDFSTYFYFCLYTPLVYFTFLRRTLKHPTVTSSGGLFSYRKQKDESGSGELPDSYYPRFSGLTSPSYDDLFDCDREGRYSNYEFTRDYLNYNHDTPLMATETAESTVTTRSGSDDLDAHNRDSMYWRNSLERGGPRQLKGLGANGTLVFEEPPRWHN